MALWLFKNYDFFNIYSPSHGKKEKDLIRFLKKNRIEYNLILHEKDFIHVIKDKKAVLCTLGNDSFRIDNIILRALAYNIPVITTEYYNSNFFLQYSNITTDYYDAIIKILSYSSQYNKNKIAFFGMNPNSTSDISKRSALLSLSENFSENDIFYTFNDNLEESFISFFKCYMNYNTVICSNDYVAVYLAKKMQALDKGWLDCTFVIGFMNSIISKVYHLPITSLSYDTAYLPQLIAMIYKNYIKFDNIISYHTIHLATTIYINQSTQNLPFVKQRRNFPQTICTKKISDCPDSKKSNNITSKTSEIQTIINIDAGLDKLNDKLLGILCMILKKKSINQISDSMFFSVDSVKYNFKKIYEIFGVSKKSELLSLLNPYINADNLEKYILSKNN